MSERLLVDCCVEEKRAMKEWAMCHTGVLRAYNNGEINGMEYRWYKYRLDDLLDNIKEFYDRKYKDTD